MVLPPAPIIDPAGAVSSSAASGDRVPKQNKGQQRWRSGKAPEWAPSSEGGEGSSSAGAARAARQVEEPAVISAGDAGVVTHDASDRRLRRLAEGRAAAAGRRRQVADAEILEGDEDEDEDERGRRHGRHVDDDDEQEEVKAESDADESEDEDKLEARRARVRELAKRRREQEGEEEEMVAEDEDEEKAGESSDSWEYEVRDDGRRLNTLIPRAPFPSLFLARARALSLSLSRSPSYSGKR
jgi:hypothetical protein